MLQEGGLLVGEPNYRSRVVGFDPVDIEALYIKRIPLEGLAVSMTVRAIGEDEVAALRALISELEGEQAHQDFHEWQRLHRVFHRDIASGAGAVLAADLEQLELRSERYQTAYKGAHLPGWWQRGEAEHRELFAAIKDRNSPLAGELAARHLARTALELLAAMAPEFDTSRLRATLRFTIEGLKAV
jgi:DNA-binding GntR family transcriptional regulator